MAQLDKTFPTTIARCDHAAKLVAAGDTRLELIWPSEVSKVEGEAGDFKVTVAKRYPYISADKCTGCGVCAEHCPIEGPSWFDEGIAPRKAIYKPFPQAVPMVYTIEKGMCIGCGEVVRRSAWRRDRFKPSKRRPGN